MTDEAKEIQKLTEDEFYAYLDNVGIIELHFKSYYKGVATFENAMMNIVASKGRATYEDAYNLSFKAMETLDDGFLWVRDNELGIEYHAPERW